MNIIIVGCGKVGSTLAEQLAQEKHNITLVDKNGKKLQDVSNACDALGVHGNGASFNTLQEAGVETADLLIAVTDSDEQNLLCCVVAKQAGNCHTVARVRNPVYNQERNFLKKELGLSILINPEFTAATEIAKLLQIPNAKEVDTFGKGRADLIKIIVKEGSPLDGMEVRDIYRKLKSQILVCSVERDGDVIIPTGTYSLMAGDHISFIGENETTYRFMKKIGERSGKIRKVLIVGGSILTYYLVKLIENTGFDVTIIEQNMDRCNELSVLLPKSIVINGDGTDRDTLIEAGLENADVFIPLTNFDEENIMLALYSRSVSKAKTVTKVSRLNFEDVINELPIDNVVYPKDLTAEHILLYIRAMANSMDSSIETLYRLDNNRVEAIEFSVNSNCSMIGQPIKNLKFKDNLLIAAIIRNSRIIFPRGEDSIQSGDSVIVVTTEKGLDDISKILV